MTLRSSGASRIRIAVVVLNYRTPRLVVDCLRAIAPEVDPVKDRVIAVDNASGDDSRAIIENEIQSEGWPHVKFVQSASNGGFSAGNNVGIRSVEADAYLLLNSDSLVLPGAPTILWETLSGAPDVGIASPRLEWPDGRAQESCFRLPSPASEVIGGSQTGPVRRVLSRWDMVLPILDGSSEPEWTSFAAVMIKRAVIERVGLLDEGFFMYFEDVDYCRRTREGGFRIVNQPTARVIHLRGGSSPVKELTRARKRRPRYYYQSRARYFRKAFGQAGLVAANAAWTFGRGISWARELLGNKNPHTVAHELMDNWRG